MANSKSESCHQIVQGGELMKKWKILGLAVLLAASLLACSGQKEPEPKDAQGYLDSGKYYFQKEDLDRALADCSHVLEINPQDGPTYYLKGLALEKSDKGK